MKHNINLLSLSRKVGKTREFSVEIDNILFEGRVELSNGSDRFCYKLYFTNNSITKHKDYKIIRANLLYAMVATDNTMSEAIAFPEKYPDET